MLYTEDSIRILAIDPGLNNTGIALVNYNVEIRYIDAIQAYNICTEKSITRHEYYGHTDNRVIKHLLLKDKYRWFLEQYVPTVVVCEAPFFYPNKPTAYKALVEVINIYKLTLAELDITIPFVQIEPLLMKSQIGVKNMSDKESVKAALDNLGINTYIDLNGLVEHSVDAIGIAIAFLKSRQYIN